MYRVCISEFVSTPWNDRLKNIICKAFEKESEKFIIEVVEGYPRKNYDIIFKEQGAIPLFTPKNINEKNKINIGTAGGMTRLVLAIHSLIYKSIVSI